MDFIFSLQHGRSVFCLGKQSHSLSFLSGSHQVEVWAFSVLRHTDLVYILPREARHFISGWSFSIFNTGMMINRFWGYLEQKTSIVVGNSATWVLSTAKHLFSAMPYWTLLYDSPDATSERQPTGSSWQLPWAIALQHLPSSPKMLCAPERL